MQRPELFDICIIGAGIVGLASAYAIARRWPRHRILVLEKEAGPARHQSGHNSNVVHAGVYYKPGSLKSELCRRGVEATRRFCELHGIAYEQRGKLIVATSAIEKERLGSLFNNAKTNGLDVDWLDSSEIEAVEPNIRGTAAIDVKSSAITDYPRICDVLVEQLQLLDVDVRFNERVDSIEPSDSAVSVGTEASRFQARCLIVCGGLQSDRLARAAGLKASSRIVPFRGEYFVLRPELSNLVHRMIYPVPDPRMPFLGIHLTPSVAGQLFVGPNAILALSREGDRRSSINARDIGSFLTFPGFWRVMGSYGRAGFEELRDAISKRSYLTKCRKYCPVLRLEDLETRTFGVRAQAVSAKGELVHDFEFLQSARVLHVANAPSPAATSAFPIGEMVADRLEALRAF